MDTIAKFHYYGFLTSLIIGDGASSNLTLFKMLSGYSGHYGIDPSLSDIHYIKPYFVSPFTGKKIFIIVCPSHMVCSIHT